MELTINYLCLALCLCVGIQGTFGQFTDEELVFKAGELGNIRGRNYHTYKTQRPIIQFLGIPYAQPPLADSRFIPAEDVSLPLGPVDAEGVYDATRSSACCPQAQINFLCSFNQKEDCLRLNIYTNRAQTNGTDLLPVIVFIHGGAFTLGSADFYNGNRLLEKDVVVVNFNYRLGILGFFCLNTNDAPGNAAMYDMVQALQFIKKYIHHFGGDPNLITLTGQSAGSVSVTHLMISPLTRDAGLFHRAIAMSGTALNEWGTTTSTDAEKASLDVAATVGCYDPSDEVYEPSDVIRCMRETPAQVLVEKLDEYQTKENNAGRLGFGPVTPVIQVAGQAPKFLDEEPEAILERHGEANVPLIMGATKHDGSFVLGIEWNKYIKANGHQDDELFLKTKLVPNLLQALGIKDKTEAVFDTLANAYLGKDVKNSGNFTLMIPGLTDLHSVFFFKAAAFRTLKLHSRFQNQSYWYSFDYGGKYTVYRTIVDTTDNPVKGGVAHGDDLLYVFTIPLSDDISAEDQFVSDRMVDYWVNFAYTGNPNIGPDGKETRAGGDWPVFSEEHPYFAVIAREDSFVNAFPNDHWEGMSDDLWPELPPAKK